jgi:hypothetical protein
MDCRQQHAKYEQPLWSKRHDDELQRFNIKQFSSKEEATTFYSDARVGYTTVSNASTPIKPEDNIYKQVTGCDPSGTNAAWKLDSVTPVTAQFSFIVQQDEFVTWGSASVLTK